MRNLATARFVGTGKLENVAKIIYGKGVFAGFYKGEDDAKLAFIN